MFYSDQESPADRAQSVLLRISSTLLNTMTSTIPKWKTCFLQQIDEHQSLQNSTNNLPIPLNTTLQETWGLENRIRSTILNIENLVMKNMRSSSSPETKNTSNFFNYGGLNFFDTELNEALNIERSISNNCGLLQKEVQRLEELKTTSNSILSQSNQHHWHILQILSQISSSYHALSFLVQSLIDNPEAHISHGQLSNDLLADDIDHLHIEREANSPSPASIQSPTKLPIATIKEPSDSSSISSPSSAPARYHFDFPDSPNQINQQQQQQQQQFQQERQWKQKQQQQQKQQFQSKLNKKKPKQTQSFPQLRIAEGNLENQNQKTFNQQSYLSSPLSFSTSPASLSMLSSSSSSSQQNQSPKIKKQQIRKKHHKLRASPTTPPTPKIGRHNPFTTTEESIPYFVGAYNTQPSVTSPLTSNSPQSLNEKMEDEEHGDEMTDEEKRLHVVGSIKRKRKKRSYDGMVTRFKLVPSPKGEEQEGEEKDDANNRSRSA